MFAEIMFAIIGLSLLGATKAQDFVSASILSSAGEVEIHRDTGGKMRVQTVAFKVSDELRAGDTIITGKNGRLVLGLSDGSQAVIAAKTTVVIQDLSQSPRTLFQVVKGKTRIQIEKLGGRPNPYRINTPTAVIAVRGTVFDVLVEDDETQVFLHEGAVDVTSRTLPERPVILSAGQTTRVRLQRPPSTPGSFKLGRNDGLFQMGRSERGGAPGGGQIADRDANRTGGRGASSPNGGSGGARPERERGGTAPNSGPPPRENERGGRGSGRKP